MLNMLLPSLKEMALEEGANVNVDETWYRYQTHFGHRKTYMWCLVNRKAGIVIFFYEDTVDEKGKMHSGGRRRAVLKEFLGDAKIKSLQSDGYNVYMYLDDEMVDIEHICCLAHVHNKLQEAKKLGYKIVDIFLAEIKKLYKREKYYANHPEIFKTPAMIKDARNDEYTNGIVDGMHKKLLDLIAKGTKNSGIYNTFISTCLQKCRNFRDFFVDYVRAWNQGRRDFGNLVRLVYAPCTL